MTGSAERTLGLLSLLLDDLGDDGAISALYQVQKASRVD